MGETKQGLELIIDRGEALRVRISAATHTLVIPPTAEGDARLVDLFSHWDQLCKELLTEAIKTRNSLEHSFLQVAALDRITALLALPSTSTAPEIAKAVELAIKRLQELELKVAEFKEAHTQQPSGSFLVPPGHVMVFRDNDGSLKEVRGAAHEHQPNDPATRIPALNFPELNEREEAIINKRFGPNLDEPRPSYVLDKLEGLMLGGRLTDAANNLKFVGEYMSANESRMSEDLFDELSRLSTKVERWAEEVTRGNMFPRD